MNTLKNVQTFVRFIDYDTFNESHIYDTPKNIIGNHLWSEKKYLFKEK